MVNLTIGRPGIYLCNAAVLFLAVFFAFFLLFPVCNVTIFVPPGYLDKKFIVLCHTSFPGKTAWENMLYVVGEYSQFFVPPLEKYPQQLKSGGGLHRWDKILTGGVYYS